MCAEEARSAVLAFFDAPATEYTVIFTSNATGGMRLVGEAFPFVQGSSYILGVDSHNSVNGIRQYALDKGAEVVYIPATPRGGMDESEAKVPAFFCSYRIVYSFRFVEDPEGPRPRIVDPRSPVPVRIDRVIQRFK